METVPTAQTPTDQPVTNQAPAATPSPVTTPLSTVHTSSPTPQPTPVAAASTAPASAPVTPINHDAELAAPSTKAQSSNKMLYLVLGILVLAAACGIAIYMLTGKNSRQSAALQNSVKNTTAVRVSPAIPSPSAVPTQTALPTGNSDTQLNQDLQNIDGSLGNADTDLGNADQGLNDQAPDLSQ